MRKIRFSFLISVGQGAMGVFLMQYNCIPTFQRVKHADASVHLAANRGTSHNQNHHGGDLNALKWPLERLPCHGPRWKSCERIWTHRKPHYRWPKRTPSFVIIYFFFILIHLIFQATKGGHGACTLHRVSWVRLQAADRLSTAHFACGSTGCDTTHNHGYSVDEI